MIIVSDTTPLHCLILIGRAELLPALFGEILIPSAVFAEMSHAKTPALVRQWVDALSSRVQIKTPSQTNSAIFGNLEKAKLELSRWLWMKKPTRF